MKGVYKKDMREVCLSRTEGAACKVSVLSLGALVPTVSGLFCSAFERVICQ